MGASPGRGPCHAPQRRLAHATLGRLLSAYPVGVFPVRGPYDISIHQHAYDASCRLLLVRPVSISLERAYTTPPNIGPPTAPPVSSYRRTQVVHDTSAPSHRLRPSPTGETSRRISRRRLLPRLGTSAAVRHLYPSHTGAPSWSLSREAPLLRLPTLTCRLRFRESPTCAPSCCISRDGSMSRFPASERLRALRPSPKRAPRWFVSEKGPISRLPTTARSRRLRPPLTVAPSVCLSWQGPCDASLHRNAHTT